MPELQRSVPPGGSESPTMQAFLNVSPKQSRSRSDKRIRRTDRMERSETAEEPDQQRLSDEDYNKLFAGEELHCLTNLASSPDRLMYLL
jgi:thymidylate kinase